MKGAPDDRTPITRGELRLLVSTLAAILGAPDEAGGAPAFYDRDRLPPSHKSVEAFNGECRRLKLNRSFKDGRGWRVPVDVWNQARRDARSTTPAQCLGEDAIDAALSTKLRLVTRAR